MRIGIDIGGVIVKNVSRDEDTSFFSDNFLATPAMADAISSIAELTRRFTPENVYIVSACGPVVQEKSLKWLKHHDFFNKSGFVEDHIYFCYARIDKAPICRALEISCFIDDRVDVLEEMSTVEHKLLFGENKSKKPALVNVINWHSVLSYLFAA